MDWMSLITYSLPPAFLVQFLNWFLNRRVNRARGEQGAVEAFIQINKDLSDMVKQQSDENKRLFIQCANLRRAAALCNSCRYASICPVIRELRRQQARDERTGHSAGQRDGEVSNNGETLEGSFLTGIPPP